MSGPTIGPDHRLSIHIGLRQKENVAKYPARKHAQRVAAELLPHASGSEGLIYLPGQATKLWPDSDQAAPFRQLRYFYYLSGTDEPGCHVTYDIAKDELTLYVSVVPPLQAIWYGPGLSIEEAKSRYDVDIVKSTDRLESDLRSWIGKNPGRSVFLLHESQKPKLDLSFTADPFESKGLQAAMDACRVIKDDYEIALVRKANEKSTLAHTAVLEHIRHFDNEREVEAIFLDVSSSHGVTSQAYQVIAGAGANAAILHYSKNNEPLKGRQLFLLDAGCDWKCYASDVTRTFPISGEWQSKEAKAIYELVDEMQSQCIQRIKPGVAMRDLQMLAYTVMVAGLQKLGVLTPDKSFDEIYESGAARIFLPHGLGHHVGLEVHDVSPQPINASSQNPEGRSWNEQIYSNFTAVPPPHSMDHVYLQPNMIITIEPGVYFSKIALEGLVTPEMEKYINLEVAKQYLPVGGVRIEDDILVTAHGHEVLTTTPKGEDALKIIRGEA